MSSNSRVVHRDGFRKRKKLEKKGKNELEKKKFDSLFTLFFFFLFLAKGNILVFGNCLGNEFCRFEYNNFLKWKIQKLPLTISLALLIKFFLFWNFFFSFLACGVGGAFGSENLRVKCTLVLVSLRFKCSFRFVDFYFNFFIWTFSSGLAFRVCGTNFSSWRFASTQTLQFLPFK